jgi:hypothetical protein
MSTSNERHARVCRTKYAQASCKQISYPELKRKEKAGKYLRTGKYNQIYNLMWMGLKIVPQGWRKQHKTEIAVTMTRVSESGRRGKSVDWIKKLSETRASFISKRERKQRHTSESEKLI